MKKLIIALMILSSCLLTSCAKDKAEIIESDAPPLSKPDETIAESETGEETHVFEVEEPPVTEESESESETEEVITAQKEKTTVDCLKSEIYYFTSYTDKGYGESNASYTKSDNILGALIFDEVSTSLTIVQNRDHVENLSGGRGFYGWFDNCIYDLSEECMSGNAVTFVTKDEIFSLEEAEIIHGKTAADTDYTIYKKTDSDGTLYYCFIGIEGDKMAAMFLSDDGEIENAYESCFVPMLNSCRTYIPNGENALEYTVKVSRYEEESDPEYSVSFTFPDTWSMGYTTASDIPRNNENFFASKRFEIARGLNVNISGLQRTNEGIGETANGYSYKWSTMNQAGSGGYNAPCTWYYILMDIPDSEDVMFISMVVYDNDKDNYYEDYCLPVIDSIVISQISE